MTKEARKFVGVPIGVIEHAARLHATGVRPGDAARIAYEACDKETISQGPVLLIGFLSLSFNIPLSVAKYFVGETLRNACRERYPDSDVYDTWHLVIVHDDMQQELELCIAEAAERNFSLPLFDSIIRR